MEKISDRIYVETGYLGSNVGCIVTEGGLVTVDCPLFPEEVEDWREKLAQISDRVVAYSISTDHHFDHSMTDGLFCKRIITHKLAYKGMVYLRENREQIFRQFFQDEYEKNKEFFDNMEVALPQITFSQQMTLSMGDCIIELTYVGGHAPSTIMINVPQEKTAFLGDNLEYGFYPYTGEARYGPWIELLNNIEQTDVENFVPGHGEICGKEGTQKLRAYFEEIRDQVKMLRQIGVTKEEAVKKAKLTGFPSWRPPPGMDAKAQMAADICRMYDQIEKKLI